MGMNLGAKGLGAVVGEEDQNTRHVVDPRLWGSGFRV
jgi:hypothetical protein